MGEVSMIPDGVRCCLGQRQVLLRPKNDINGEYLLFALQAPAVQHEILWNEGTGSTVSNVRIPVLKKLNIPRHPGKENDIADILSALVDKIEINRQINQTLEHIAQAIFKSWFVDFEPVKAKIHAKENGQDPERAAMCAISGKTDTELDAWLQTCTPEQRQQLTNTAALFPDELEDSVLGPIPKGWVERNISEWGEVVCGKTPPKKNPENYGGDIPFIKIPDMHGKVFITQTTDSLSAKGAEKQRKKQVPKGSVCVSCIATVGQVVIPSEYSHTNQQINTIVPNNFEHTQYLYFSMLERKGLLHDLASGGSATLNLNTGNFSKIPLIYPAEELLSKYFRIATLLFEAILEQDIESRVLGGIRDALLPKLLSGEISLSKAQDKTEAVA